MENFYFSLAIFYSYWELVPDLEVAKQKIKELEQQLEEACKKLEEREGAHKQMYLQMYNQGHEAAKLEHEKQANVLPIIYYCNRLIETVSDRKYTLLRCFLFCFVLRRFATSNHVRRLIITEVLRCRYLTRRLIFVLFAL